MPKSSGKKKKGKGKGKKVKKGKRSESPLLFENDTAQFNLNKVNLADSFDADSQNY